MGKAWWLSGLVAVMTLGMAASASANLLPVGQWDLNEGAGTVAHNDFLLSSGKENWKAASAGPLEGSKAD